MRQHEVRRVAAGADRRHGQAALEEALAVDAVHVVFQDVGLGDLPRQADRRAFAMAAAAEARDLHDGDRGTGARGTQDVVRAVARLAARGGGVAGRRPPAVHALDVLLLLVPVAGPAVDLRQLVRVRKLLHVAVARGAVEVGVGRGLQGRGVEVRGLARFSLARARSRLVAGGAIFGGRRRSLLAGEDRGERQDGEGQEKGKGPGDRPCAGRGHPSGSFSPVGPPGSFFPPRSRRRSSSIGCSSSISRSVNIPVSQAMFIG